MATIKKLGKNKYQVRFHLGRQVVDGKVKQLRESHNLNATLAEVQQFARRRELELASGDHAPQIYRTLTDALDAWLAQKRQEVAPRTYSDYAEAIHRYVTGTLGARKLDDLHPATLRQFLDDLRERVSARTVRHLQIILKSALQDATNLKQMRGNPLDQIKLPKRPRRQPPKVWTPEQALQFLAASATSKHATLFRLALETGLRPEETLALFETDINWKRGELSVQRALCWRRGKGNAGHYYNHYLKTAHARRVIPLSADLRAALEVQRDFANQLRRIQYEQAAKQGTELHLDPLLFPSEIGSPLHPDNLRKRHFAPLVEQAGLPATGGLYLLRHTAASMLFNAGINPKTISERLGHANVAFTIETYCWNYAHQQDEATAKIGELLRAKPPEKAKQNGTEMAQKTKRASKG